MNPWEHIIIKHKNYAVFAGASTLAASCNKQKDSIGETEKAALKAIGMRKDDVNEESATEQTERHVETEKAAIEANRESTQSQLDAVKKKAKAKADAAKAGLDAGKPWSCGRDVRTGFMSRVSWPPLLSMMRLETLYGALGGWSWFEPAIGR